AGFDDQERTGGRHCAMLTRSGARRVRSAPRARTRPALRAGRPPHAGSRRRTRRSVVPARAAILAGRRIRDFPMTGPTFQELILTLNAYWAKQGCVLIQPLDLEVGAGTFHPATFLRSIGPEPW